MRRCEPLAHRCGRIAPRLSQRSSHLRYDRALLDDEDRARLVRIARLQES
ncbi:hypothetical protein [Kutzneria kofuensis]|uniref:Uncharacterized protein n=1 Tax=Kutzneria kofuensis TaxID=103725 RepID=A0A7W9NL05_9PSEU|nr:hypothetical protein [Kutzneria kofuensis]MBB5896555.1 hypothetical protein [Kutzneria kofuensis]